MNFLNQLWAANGPVFTFVFLMLFVGGAALVIWRVLLNLSVRTDLPPFLSRLEEALTQGGIQAALELCQQESGLAPQIFATALQTHRLGKVATRTAISNLIELDLLPRVNRLLPLILLLAKLAPMLGLLGTVVGMILAFGKIAGQTKVDPSALANDIGMALYTTAEGLLLAVPLILAYTLFREYVSKVELDLQRAAQVALSMLPQLSRFPQ
ncbi:MAG: MotA/TolQ/ExbB proton channel family protein [Pirellulales bacterium]|nr:MotA/TolQ/ExbB proton channel family protein [Pirellulales bacterium]